MESSLGSLAVLSPDILDCIVSCLPVKDILRLSVASKYLHSVCNQEPLWKQKWLLGRYKEATYQGGWKALMLRLERPEEDIVKGLQSCRQPDLPLPDEYHYWQWQRCHCDPEWVLPLSLPPDKQICHRQRGGGLPGSALQPEVWTGLMDSWSTHKWTQAEYMQPLLQTRFRVAKPAGGTCFMTLLAYLQYASTQCDEEPLYIFDEDFAARAPCLAEDYTVPEGTPQDQFEIMGRARPAYRWLIMGPKRSGSSWHQDPTGTWAWNALVAGTKWWLFYPPHVRPPGVKVSITEEGDQDVDSLSPISWVLEVYPHLSPEMKPQEHIQRPGEIIYLPSGWWHCVINAQETIAVTQNYVPLSGLEGAVEDLAYGSGYKLIKPSIDHSQGLAWSTGFTRSAHLGAWLCALTSTASLDQKAQLHSLGKKYCNLDHWHEKVKAIAATCNLQLSTDWKEALPISGGPTVVFEAGSDAVIKFYTKGTQMGSLDAYIELSALRHLTACGKDATAVLPGFIGAFHHGPEDVFGSAIEGLGDVPCTGCSPVESYPWIVMEYCSGRPISPELATPECVQLIGKALACLHQCPLGKHTLFKDEDIWLASIHCGDLDSWACRSGWEPFKQFLKRRRAQAYSELFSSAALPLKLLEDLEAYLPKDVSSLFLDIEGDGEPSWLHGDLTPANILLSSEAGSKNLAVRFIDFGDSGHGDPLYDLIPLHIITLRCTKALTAALLQSYKKHYPTGSLTRLRSRGIKPSYCAMCYTLMHEQDILRIFELNTALWNLNSLIELQENVWGFLDNLC